MKTRIAAPILILILALLNSCLAIAQQAPEKKPEQATTPRALKIKDANDWQRISGFTISPNGKWVAHLTMPSEGDGKLFLAEREGKTRHEWVVGSGSGQIQFSHDSKYVAWMQSPLKAKADAAKKAKKPIKRTAVLFTLSDGKKTEFANAQTFSFSGESPRGFVVKKNRPAGRPSGDAGWDGTDLLIHNFESNRHVNIGNVKSFSFNKSGEWLALVMDAEGKSGNGVQLFQMANSRIMPLESDSAKFGSLNWNREGNAIAFLKSKADKKYKRPPTVLVAFKNVGESSQQRVEVDPAKESAIPETMTISSNATPTWSDDLSMVVFGIHDLQPKENNKEKSDKSSGESDKKTPPKPAGETADLVIWHWQDKRMQSMQQVQESRDRRRFDYCVYQLDSSKTLRLGDDEIPRVSLARPHRFAIGSDNSKYERMGNLDGRRYQDVYAINLKSGKRQLFLEKSRFGFGTGPSGIHYLYYQDGHFHVYNLATESHTNITKNVSANFVDIENDTNVDRPPRRPMGWSSDGNYALLSDGWDIWKVAVDGSKAENLTGDGNEKQIRYGRPMQFDPDQLGIDFSKPVYLSLYGEWTKKAGFGRIQAGKKGVENLVWEDASFSGLNKLKDHDLFYFSKTTQQTPRNFFVAGANLNDAKQHTDSNPQRKNFKWSSGVRLVEYKDKEGRRLQGALYLPAGYIEGKKYPTIVYMYEKLSQRANQFDAPRHGGFSASIYLSNGYAVFNPDIIFRINDPGVSSKECILAGLDAAIETGVVDAENVGIHGHSWGGYQTSFIITQTDRFKAAVAGAPLTNLISMYSSVYWNSGSANQPIFESSQGRFTGGYWTNIEAYTRNSPVYFAEKVTTPLLLLHNDADGAVDWNQGIEYFNTLRRLNKPVVMLQYKGENHGLRKTPNRKDYSYRMMQFFDHHLKGKDAPNWWKQGVKHLDHKEHIKDFQKQTHK